MVVNNLLLFFYDCYYDLAFKFAHNLNELYLRCANIFFFFLNKKLLPSNSRMDVKEN